MSVIVMGAELPKEYEDCWYLQCDSWKDCYINGMRDNCPLRPLPEKHGRLIDLDALLDRINGEERPEMYDGMDEVFWIQKCLEEATAIVESEGE